MFNVWGAVAVLAIVTTCSSAGQACGGCFHGPEETSVVTGHRMAFAVSSERTVLWDQFVYQGSPEEFAWVLPIMPGAYLELSSQAWFDALEGLTATTIRPPNVSCADDSSGCEDGRSASFTTTSDTNWLRADAATVTVLSRKNVGPYETVTLRSSDGMTLTSWLHENDFVLPDDIEPIVDAYVAEGWDFLALKLRPGVDVTRMEPVRVVTPGGPPELPLRMVSAGVGKEVDIVLYVIAEGRHSIGDLEPVQIDEGDLRWNFDEDRSNYDKLRNDVLTLHDGRNVLTSFAQPRALTDAARRFSVAGDDVTISGSFPEVYGELADGSCPSEVHEPQAGVVHDPCYGYAEADIPVPCDPTPDLAWSAHYVCGSVATDLAAALVGLHPARTWLTRLEMRLPKEALDMDCSVEATRDDQVENLIVAADYEGDAPCDLPVFSASLVGRTASERPSSAQPSSAEGARRDLGWLLALGLVLGARRRAWRAGTNRDTLT